MEIRWLEDALADLTETYLYIEADNPSAAAVS
jgi:plasmid stabilization system protein ParE